jgi:hypothetical protein
MFPIGVVFTEDWQYNKDVMTLDSDTNGKKVFQVFKSGTHTLTYVLKDNRNNEARVEYTFVVNEQNPMELRLLQIFKQVHEGTIRSIYEVECKTSSLSRQH